MAKIYLEVYGCSVNLSEAEVMKGILSKEYEIVSDIKDAELIVVSICSVKGDIKALKRLRDLKNKYPDKLFVVAGCIPNSLVEKLKEYGSLVNTHNVSKILKIVDETLEGKYAEALGINSEIKINLLKKRENEIIAIVPISSGCYSSCTYCSVRLIKGKLISYPEEMILKEVKEALKEGCKEIWITAQDTVCYGMEINGESKLPELIKKITSIEGDFIIRIGMMNPKHIIKILPKLIEVFKNDKVFKFLHIPVQAGNDEILEKMNRGYKIKNFIKIIEEFRKEIPEITISTDIICGFPGETEKQFEDSLELVKKIKPAVLNISRFIAREGTEAWKLKQIPSWIIKERSRKLTKEFKKIALEENKKWIGLEGIVLIDEKGKGKTLVARNNAYKPIILKEGKIGSKVKVKIKDATENDLRTF